MIAATFSARKSPASSLFALGAIALAFLCAARHLAAENASDARTIVESIRRSRDIPWAVLGNNPKEEGESVLEYVRKERTSDTALRNRVTDIVVHAEFECPSHPSYKTRSANYILLDVLAVEALKGDSFRALELWNLYHPSDIVANPTLHNFTLPSDRRRLNKYLLLVFGESTALTPDVVVSQVKAIRNYFDQGSKFNFADAVLARYGDLSAEQRLVGYAATVGSPAGSCVDELKDIALALGYIQSKSVKQVIAKGLHSEDMVPEASGGAYPRRAVYALALWYAIRDEPDLPVLRNCWLAFTENQIDAFEEWCARHWGIEYPSTPRKPLRSKHGYTLPAPKPRATSDSTAMRGKTELQGRAGSDRK